MAIFGHLEVWAFLPNKSDYHDIAGTYTVTGTLASSTNKTEHHFIAEIL
jgi:hypothetical protein